MSSLPDREKQTLLEIARREVQRAAQGNPPDSTEDLAPHIPCAGVFVTLRRRGRLRGCIGQLSPRDSLAYTVAYCARSAALEDPRFKPLRPEELLHLEIEISVLSPAEAITVDRIEPGQHGLVVRNGARRGVLLPQVAAQFHWNAQRFLEETCMKAGLDRHAWKDSATEIRGFTTEVFAGSAESLAEENQTCVSGTENAL